jgi:molybdenum cofactor cytidylyltransferase
MTQGVILAAGYASRAKTNKMLLPIENQSMIERAIEGMKPFVSMIFVVTGHYHDAISSHLKDNPLVKCIENPSYENGMFSSVLMGVNETSEDFFILPGDCPFVSQKTYQKLLAGTKTMRVPNFQHKNGHPIWISKELKNDLLQEPITSNLKLFRNRYDFEMIDVKDPNVLIDIDTQKEYNTILNQIKGSD